MTEKMTRRRFLQGAGAAAMATVFRPTRVNAQNWTVTGEIGAGLTAFDNVMQSFMQLRGVPAGTLAVTYHGRLVLARGYSATGETADIPQPTSLFRFASVAKPITSTAVLLLVADGTLHLEDRLVDYIDFTPLNGQTSDPRLSQITIDHLLRHAGGWDRDLSFDPMWADFRIVRELGLQLPISNVDIIRYMAGVPLDFAPGKRSAYSNFGYMLLARIIESATGVPYGDFVKRRVFAPLGVHMELARSRFEHRLPDEVLYHTVNTASLPSVFAENERVPQAYGSFNLENMDANGGWVSSAVDMVRFATAFDKTAATPLLPTELEAKAVAVPPTGIEEPAGLWYGYGWNARTRGEQTVAWHTGVQPGTFATVMRYLDEIDYAVVFNQMDDVSGLRYREIVVQLNECAENITSYPDIDLFGDFLTQHSLRGGS
jgi:CubicO group peptidase (beta-lactamase class C family)